MFKINNNVNIDLTPINESIDKINNEINEINDSIFNLNDSVNQISNNQNLTWFTLNSISQRTDALMISDVMYALSQNTVNYTNKYSINYSLEYKVPYCHAVSENNDIYHKQLTESSEILGLQNPTTYTRGVNLQSISKATDNSNIYTESVFNRESMYFYGMNDYNLLKNYNYGLFIEPEINNSIMQGLTYDAVLHGPTRTSTIYGLNFGSVNVYNFTNRTSSNYELSFNSNNSNIRNFVYWAVQSMPSDKTLSIYDLNCPNVSFNPYCTYQTNPQTNTAFILNLKHCNIDELIINNTGLYLDDCTIHSIYNDRQRYNIAITKSQQTIEDLYANDGRLDVFCNLPDLTMNRATLKALNITNMGGITYNDCLLNVSDGIQHSMILNATNCSITSPEIANVNTQLPIQAEFKNCSLKVCSYTVGNGNIIAFDNCTLSTDITFSGENPTIDFNQCQGLQWIDGTVSFPTFNFNSMLNTGLTIASVFSCRDAFVSLVNCSSFSYHDAFQSVDYYISNMKDCKLQVGNLDNIDMVSNATLTLYDLDRASIRTFNPTLLGNNSINFTCDSTATYKISAPNYGGADAILKIDGWDDTQSKNAYISILPNIKQLTISNCSLSFITNWPTINKTISLYNNSYINDSIQISGLNYVGMDNGNSGQPFSSLTLRSDENLVLGKNIGKSVGVFDCTHPIFQNCRPSQLLAYTCNIVDINDTKISGSMEFKNCNTIVFYELSPISHHATLSFKDCNIVDFYLCTNLTLDAAAFDNISRMSNPVSQIRTISIKPSDNPYKYCYKYTSIVNI